MAETESSADDWTTDLGKKFDVMFGADENIDNTAEDIINNVLDEAILEEVFAAHKNEKDFGTAEHDPTKDESKKFEIQEGTDDCVFGQFDAKSSMTLCLRCPRRYATKKFTTHFESCVSNGRRSSRVAKLKIANIFIKNAYGEMSDEEWKSPSEKPKRRKVIDKKKGQEKGGIKRGKQIKKSSVKCFIT